MKERECGVQPGGWRVVELAGTAAELHGRELPTDPADAGRQVWVMAPTAAALVLGSTQRPERAAVGGATDVEVVRRRSGGGAVLVDPATTVWLDVIVGRDDPLWDHDVGRAFLWLGDVWAAALAGLGFVTTVHRGPLVRTTWSDLVCFAGTGPGEVLLDGRKVVGLSQRRTRAAARFQCALYLGDGPAPVAAVAPLVVADPGRAALVAALDGTTGALPVGRGPVIEAFVTHLPSDHAAYVGCDGVREPA